MAIKNNWIYKNYKEGDEIQILNLFEKVFGKKMALGFWKWRFIENPFGPGIIKLLFENDLLIGHYAVIPMVVQVKNGPVQTVFSMTTMTHPDYQGQGIFSYLAGEMYREVEEKGFGLVYGFPNKNSHYGFVNKLDWKDLGRIIFFYKELKNDFLASIPQDNNVCEVKNFDNAVDLLWDRIKKNYCVIVPRTKDFLNWRFIKNPETNYKIYSVKNKEKMSGYVVLKLYKRENEEIGHIVDILGENDSTVEKLLQVSYNYFFENNIKKISCWMQDSYSPGALMTKEGFIRNDFNLETYFGVKILNEKNNSLKEAECFNNWYLTMGDSDVF